MPDNPSPEPSFNLWYEPWIDLECLDGSIERVGIGPALLEAHRYRAIVSHSPLEVAGIQRLLVAVLQDALNRSIWMTWLTCGSRIAFRQAQSRPSSDISQPVLIFSPLTNPSCKALTCRDRQ